MLNQFMERRITIKVHTHDERIDEKADHSFQLGAVAAGNGGTNNNIRLSRLAIEQYTAGPQQGHKHCASRFAA